MAEPSRAASAAARRTWLAHVGDLSKFDRELAKILRDAARDAERILLSIVDDSVSAAMRRAQLQIAISQLTQLSNEMWGGQITPTMNRWAAVSVDRAIDGVMAIDKILAQTVSTPGLRNSIITASQNSVDTLRSRLLNSIDLSPKVYKTRQLTSGWVQREINRGILRNASARDIAKSVSSMINPNTPGGVSYAARRLGRTELNNAFHTTTVRSAAIQPWNLGMQWNLSGSHPVPDECDDYASADDSGLGQGIYPMEATPGKPHPQCLCYLTVVQQDEEDFINSLVDGEYNDFLESNS